MVSLTSFISICQFCAILGFVGVQVVTVVFENILYSRSYCCGRWGVVLRIMCVLCQ